MTTSKLIALLTPLPDVEVEVMLGPDVFEIETAEEEGGLVWIICKETWDGTNS